MLQKVSVLVIEDEKSICDFIAKTLNAHDYRASVARTGKDGLAILTSVLPDLVLLDLGLPDMDGIEIIKKTREWSSLPIIVISARSQEQEKVAALDAGADDYITKPFGTEELLARIRTSVRHSNKLMSDNVNANRPYSAKGLTVDFEKRLVTVDGKEVHLTRVEYKIVSMLAQNSGKVITYSSLISQVWGPYADDNNRILRVNMANIRRKLEKNPGEPLYIFTELGVGYRIIEDENLGGMS
jgi:two-component system KDP operon response regulator KdpE